MCEFCENGLDKELEEKEINIGFLGELTLSLEMELADKTGYGENRINAWLGNCNDNIRASIEINFCPICGRDLRSEENE